MRKTMVDHAITTDDIVERIHASIGGDKSRIEEAVIRFISGDPGSMAVHMAIISFVAEHQQATKH